MKRAHEKYGKDGLVVLGFNSDKEVGKMLNYIKEKDYGWSHWFMGEKQKPIEKQFWIDGYPTNFLIGRDGRIITRSLRVGRGGEKQIEKALQQTNQGK